MAYDKYSGRILTLARSNSPFPRKRAIRHIFLEERKEGSVDDRRVKFASLNFPLSEPFLKNPR